MGRPPSNDDSGLKKGPWTPEEDQKLVKYIQKHGHGSWRALPKLAGLNRCGKSCRLRWTNYLRPDIKRGKFSQEEEQTILNLHAVLGNKWSAIAGHLPGRTDNEIKNFWNTHLKKKLIQMGFDPMTHRPRTDIFSSLPHLIALANLKELMEHHSWEEQAVRLQAAEAAQMATLQYLQTLLHPPLPSSTSNLNSTTFSHDMSSETSTIYNLLSSLSSMKDQDFGLGTSTLQPILHDDSIPFLHLPDLQSPLKNDNNIIVQAPPHELTGFNQGELSSPNNSQWLASSSSTPSPSVAPPMSNLGDACSTSSYGGVLAPFAWPELLLEYPLFDNEIS